MADFYINRVPTFSLLEAEDIDAMEGKLIDDSRKIPMGALIPALFSDMSSAAMKNIIDVLSKMPIIKRVYICLDQSSREEFKLAKEIAGPLGSKAALIWNDSPELRNIISDIEKELSVGIRGKGHSVWTGLGYVIAKEEVAALAFHDADIITYDKNFLLRLLYPIVHLEFQFSKGYYVRYNEHFYGRVSRLFYFPFIRALKDIFGLTDFLDYMGDFRYPLSGEFAIFVNQAKILEFPSDWGLEIGILGEIFRNMRNNRICQIELTARYDHKHQEMVSHGKTDLQRMSSDIARTFFTFMASDGRIIGRDAFSSIRLAYMKNAREMVNCYEAFAEIYSHRIKYNLHDELNFVDIFAHGIDNAMKDFYRNQHGSPMIPDWKRVESAVPKIQQRLIDAVEKYF
jgi:glucosyl-3-phosphoglycerate synthase